MWTSESRALVGDIGAGQALSDEQYALLAPLIPPAKPGGRPRTTNMRRLLDGLFYLVRTGCQWRHLPPPPAFPPWRTVYGYMRTFASLGVWETMRHHSRRGAGRASASRRARIGRTCRHPAVFGQGDQLLQRLARQLRRRRDEPWRSEAGRG